MQGDCCECCGATVSHDDPLATWLRDESKPEADRYAAAAEALILDLADGVQTAVTVGEHLGSADRHYLSGVRDVLLVLTGEIQMEEVAALRALEAQCRRLIEGKS